MIYFDNAATTLIKPDGVYDAVLYGIKNYGNPGRGGHKYSLDAGEAVFQCREKLAELFKISDSENIVFTQNATHSLNIAIRSIVGKGDAVLTTGFEHNSVMRVLFAIGADVRLFGTKLFDSTETVRQLRALINRSIKCVIVNHVSNVFGFIQPVYEISDICKKYGVPLIIDCSQSAGCLDIDQSRLNAAFLCMPGHKGLMGPQGTGVLVCGSADKKPLLFGGTGSVSELMSMPDFLPDRLEAGTPNTPGIYGLSKGVEYILEKGTENIYSHERALVSYLKRGIGSLTNIKGYFSEYDNQCGVVSVNHTKTGCEDFASLLDRHGIAVRAGLHCSPYAHKSAGTFETGTVRLSFSCFNTENEVYQLINILKFADSTIV